MGIEDFGGTLLGYHHSHLVDKIQGMLVIIIHA